MAITISRDGDLYRADVTPPHGGATSWRSAEPRDLGTIVADLQALGCHQTDIGDALYEADPDWLAKLIGAPDQS